MTFTLTFTFNTGVNLQYQQSLLVILLLVNLAHFRYLKVSVEIFGAHPYHVLQ